MDIIPIGSNFVSKSPIEGFESLIWTERFMTCGEFKLVTTKIDETIAAMPLDTFAKLAQSNHIMFVESHSIDVDQDGVEKLTVSGRSLECIYDTRIFPPYDYNAGDYTATYQTYAYVAEMLKVFSGTKERGTSSDSFDTFIRVQPYNPLIAYGTFYNWALENGPIGPQLEKVRLADKVGVAPELFDVYTNGIPTDYVFKMRVYVGTNRGLNSNVSSNKVIFSTKNATYQAENYLMSNKDLRNIALVRGSDGRRVVVFSPGVDNSVKNIARKILDVDASDIDINSDTPLAISQKMENRGFVELGQHNAIKLIQGKVPAYTNFKYNIHYTLGDVVTVVAEHGFQQDMRVVEFIRTQDKNGETAYPVVGINEGYSYNG